jgi:hypothetical protein
MTILQVPDRLVAATARGVTRRRFVRRAGSVALGGVIAGAYVLRPEEARAACNWDIAPCSGSPLCGGFRCDGYKCIVSSTPHTNWSCYTRYLCCNNAGTANCWCNGGTRCCDCCAYDAGCKITECTCHSSNHWGCICRGACT